ncbi:MAG: DEAD/DEAH box helicase [Elusimicrobiota bacterium]|nr:DEAD/DEAH box helicase [Elusimicrobiota bacterium]
MSFSSFGLHNYINSALAAAGFVEPTPIQAGAIPVVMRGQDVLGLAQTGTGKTAAFALPILDRLMKGPRGRVRALVLAPTRELAEQIREDFDRFGKHTGLRAASVYGGAGMDAQAKALRGRAEIIVACPGRLLDHMGRGASLGSVEVLVLDEADRMFDMGFLPDVRRIIAKVPATRQTLLFSATMPDDVRKLTKECLRDAATVSVSHGAATTVSHALYPVPEHLKAPLLLELLYRHRDDGSVLVFVRTKRRAEKVGDKLKQAGHAVATLQGNLSQSRRKAAIDGFKSGAVRVLVATDIAARGIDVSQITHVINYDVPDTPEAYTHRIGRTGRAARTGDAFTFVTPADAAMVRDIERKLGRAIESRKLEGFDYGAPMHAVPSGPSHPHPRPQQRHQQPGHGHGGHAHGPHAGRHRRRFKPRGRPQGGGGHAPR